MTQISPVDPHEHITNVRINRNRLVIKIRIQEKSIMYACIWIDSTCFKPWHECVLTPNYLLNTMGGCLKAENGWRCKHDFSRMLKILQEFWLGF